MKRKRQEGGSAKATAAAQPPPAAWAAWHWIAAAAVSLVVAFIAYDPALEGPFVLDDLYLPFGLPDAPKFELAVWIARRPLLGLTYLANYRASGPHPMPYHVVNVLLHVAVAWLVFVILRHALRRFGETERRLSLLAGFGAMVFLLHPIQTEAVAYIASRSDVLSSLFAFAALAVFLQHRGAGVGWPRAALILALFAAGLASKEPVIVLPAAFLLLDVFWTEDGLMDAVKRNWRLHGPVAAGGIAGLAWVLRGLRGMDTIGADSGFTWQQYLFTQFRVVWHYVRLSLLPVGQNADTDFAVSKTITEHGAILGLAGIAVAAAAAVLFRKRAPLAAAGVFLFLLFLAPTSSFVPISDTVAERRVYFASLGLLLILMEGGRRVRTSQAAVVASAIVLVLLAAFTHTRAAKWGDEMALWQDTVEKSPNKMRPRFQLAYQYYTAQKCPEAAGQYAEAARLATKPDSSLMVNWALALDCEGKPADAVEKLRQAAAIDNTFHIQSQLGMVLARVGRYDEALAALSASERLKTDYVPTHIYKGNVYAAQEKWAEADAAFRRALDFDPANAAAIAGRRFVAERTGNRNP